MLSPRSNNWGACPPHTHTHTPAPPPPPPPPPLFLRLCSKIPEEEEGMITNNNMKQHIFDISFIHSKTENECFTLNTRSNTRCIRKTHKHIYHIRSLIQWITSCHKNRMTTSVITLGRKRVTSLTTSVSTIHCYYNNKCDYCYHFYCYYY